ncbi:sterol desaturase family protein [Flavobacterium chilense]|uniref:Sterol desaturase/sphingolipid hydroxylase, fatty acid hydroxylase superfamily n=1 Tax=Flavobacterium chilense TaxID=946677 RepID=A0A1M7MCZ4_9FLAO|nr:sterol desaturase family protein [Flavobacterium chilense]SHM88222.1 Sterol desaturase/sphingolipid hydroxylase, fatty acid hydroxylase superfamily [Flavobacterium chilense]
MEKYIEIIVNSYGGYFNYLINEILYWKWDNYFYGLIAISLMVWLLEITFPWRKNQPIFRKDFWLDLFYLFFNFYILNLILVIALSNVSEQLLNDLLSVFGLQLSSIQLFSLSNLPKPIALLAYFVIGDFLQWNIHRLLHRVPFLWKIHKTHHSPKQMGFATQFRYNWMEAIIYKSIAYFPLILIGGFQLQDVFIIHFIAIAIGHLNHANLGWDYGFFKYFFNNPKMHIWHHSKELPSEYGVNFGISLSIWDYLFKTNYIPFDGKNIELGFDDENQFPVDFIQQELYPFRKE